MSIAASLLPEFDHEMANTRRVLERVVADRMDWRPHEKSWTMGGLATHLAMLPGWTGITVNEDEFDMAPKDGAPPAAAEAKSAEELLSRFDENVKGARATIESASDETLLGPWSLLSGGEKVFTQPRVAVLRSFVMNHVIHHRAQLGLYLRLSDQPVPAIYGPSADEEG
jgi:uncharacterized damage-inducible protein DinB